MTYMHIFVGLYQLYRIHNPACSHINQAYIVSHAVISARPIGHVLSVLLTQLSVDGGFLQSECVCVCVCLC